MVSVKIIAVGRLKEPYFKAAFDEYAKRLSPFCRLTAEEIEQERLPDSPSDKEIEKALETEAEKILAKIPSGSCVIKAVRQTHRQVISPCLSCFFMIRHSSIRIRFIHTVLQTLAFSIPYLFHQVVLNESGIFRLSSLSSESIYASGIFRSGSFLSHCSSDSCTPPTDRPYAGALHPA